MEEEQTSREFFRHADSGEIYLLKRTWYGDLISSAGPLTQPLKEDADDYELKTDKNNWMLEQGEQLKPVRVFTGFVNDEIICTVSRDHEVRVAYKEKEEYIRLRTFELLKEGLPGAVKALDEWIDEATPAVCKEIDRITAQETKGLTLSTRDKEYRRQYYKAVSNRDCFYKYYPDAKLWRLSLFERSICILIRQLRLKGKAEAGRDIDAMLAWLKHAFNKDLHIHTLPQRRLNRTDMSPEEVKERHAAIADWFRWNLRPSAAPPPTPKQIEDQGRRSEDMRIAAFWQDLKDFRDMVADAAEEIEIEQAEGSPTRKGGKRKKVKAKKRERRFKPWKNAGDACFVIVYTTEGNWTEGIHFHRDGEHQNLSLRGGSRTETLLIELKDNSLAPELIKARIGNPRTEAKDKVTFANGLLNEKIRGTGFTILPDYDVLFVALKSGTYECIIPIYVKDEFDHEEIKQASRRNRRN